MDKLTHKERKDIPVFTGFLNYFPDAIREVAKASRIANEQHNPNTPVHWDRAKSGGTTPCTLMTALGSGTFLPRTQRLMLSSLLLTITSRLCGWVSTVFTIAGTRMG